MPLTVFVGLSDEQMTMFTQISMHTGRATIENKWFGETGRSIPFKLAMVDAIANIPTPDRHGPPHVLCIHIEERDLENAIRSQRAFMGNYGGRPGFRWCVDYRFNSAVDFNVDLSRRTEPQMSLMDA